MSKSVLLTSKLELAEIQGHTFYLPALNAGSIIVDLGASSGGFSKEVHGLTGARCSCVEAASANFKLIEPTDTLHPFHFAIGGTDGPITVNLTDEALHWGTTEALPGIKIKDTEEVVGITLLKFLDDIGLDHVDLLKVDIEGAEIAMFDATPDHVLDRIDQITIEFHDFLDPAQGPDVERIKRRLIDAGFQCVVMTRQFHGDVWFVRADRLGLSWGQMFFYAYGVKYLRGIGRMLRRQA